MLKIAIVGPESSGKSTLCAALAAHYRCAWMKEYARVYLEERGADYTQQDLLHIAAGQLMGEAETAKLAHEHGPGLFFCDTDMLTIKIWSLEVFSKCHPIITELARDVLYDHWLLCRPDLPWVPDPLRENPHDRDRLFAVWESELKKLRKPYTIICGSRSEREKLAVEVVDALLATEQIQ